jgi:hypothetical protein
MRKIFSLAAACVLGASFTMAGAAQAQIGIAGGPSVGVGDVADDFELGYHVQASLGVPFALLPVGLRVDGAFHRFPGKSDLDLSLLKGSANVVLGLPGLGIRPYAIAGLGVYHARFTEDDAGGPHVPHVFVEGNETAFGINAGAGIRIPLGTMSAIIEARFHHAMTERAVQLIPISFGLVF